MDLTFKIRWRHLWLSLTKFIVIGITVPAMFVMALRWFRLGFDEAFRHLSPLMAVLLIPGVVAFSAVCSLLIALPSRLMSVRLTDQHLEGRNYWGMRRRLPLAEITDLSRVDANGLRAVAVSSRRHGKVYILDQTENVGDLLALLETCRSQATTPETTEATSIDPGA